MFYIYFICLLILFCWFITRNPFFTKSGLGAKLLVSLFLIRIIVAVGGYYFNLFYYPGSDSMRYQQFGIEEYELLFSDPKIYFSNLFMDGYGNGYSGFFSTTNSFWNNLGPNLIIKLLSLFNLISFKNFLINTLLFNCLIFFGPVAFYRAFIDIFPNSKYPLIVVSFLLPSTLFYSSFPHKEGILLLSLSLLIYHIYFYCKKRELKRILYIFLCILFILFIRSFVLIVLIPALVALFVTKIRRTKPLKIYISIYSFFTILFFISSFISPKINLPEYISKRQSEFLNLSGLAGSSLPTNDLQPNLIGFIKNTPQALNHVFLRPYLFEGEKWVYIPFALEIFVFELLFLVFLFFRKKGKVVPPLIYFLLFFSLSMLLVIGYTIPILGAFVRYRSIYFPFLILPVLVYTDWESVRKILRFPNPKIH
ncbi:MAG: hypothetical protein ABIW47_07020 [Ginsengibacter sp.]